MTRGLRLTLALLLVAAATAAGCESDRVADCVAPANEAALLDELADDPVLDVTISGATRRAEPKRQEACHRKGIDVSRTGVTVEYDLAHDPSIEEIWAAFDPVATDGGWTAMPALDLSQLGGVLRYCRVVLSHPTLLTVGWQFAKGVDSQRIPAHLAVDILSMGYAACSS